jgi:hypothetical protein
MRSKFLKIPSLYVGDKPGEWELSDTLIYASELTNNLIVVPVGFVTDLASIPQRLRGIIRADGRERLPAIVHDYLYRNAPRWCDRALADAIFFEALVDCGESYLRRQALYIGVRAFGWMYWGECSK